MSALTTGKGVWNGWHWRYVGTLIVAIAVLQLVSFYALHLPFNETTELATFVAIWLIVTKVKERRLANTLVGMSIVFFIGIVFQLTMDPAMMKIGWLRFVEVNGPLYLFCLGLSYLYLRMNNWSERKRVEMEAKRMAKVSTTTVADKPPVRVHRKKKRR